MSTTFNEITGARRQQSPYVQKVESFTRPNNATAYAAGDSVAPVTIAVTAASNANPIVITAAAHGLVTGDRVFIAAVGGNTNANGIRRVTVLTADTFSLQHEVTGANIAGNAAYTAGGTVQRILRLQDVVPENGGQGSIIAVRLQVRNATVANGTFRVRFYNSPVDQIADNAAFTLLDANKAKRLGYVDLTILTTDGAGSDSSEVQALLAQPMPFTCEGARKDLYVQIIALGAFVPAANDTIRLEVTIKRDTVPGVSKLTQT
jgi:hypothetical protein